MKGAAQIVGAGGAFAATTLAGFVVGIWIGHRTGEQFWVLGGLMAGLLVGGYSAFRMLARALA
ncbi:MAG: hypothetical protein JOZ77_06645 [Candidatus Eremiobacteraeota bacterium]|nr:hypothetical protein [Candidatus Eremiobacteraeota bacterium]